MQELDPTQPAPFSAESSGALPTSFESTPPDLLTPEPPKPTLRRLFFGDDGLRAGWSVLLFLLITAALLVLLNLVVHHFHHPVKPKTPPKQPVEGSFRSMFIGEGSLLLVLLFSGWLMSLIEKRPFSRYGFRLKRMPTDILLGFFWGLLCLSILVGTMVLTHALSFDGLLLHGQLALVDGMKWFIGFLLVGFVEEFLFRGSIH
jgi:membrane protease YdiL (CAAX protease family)